MHILLVYLHSEAILMDAQQRMLLEMAYEAIKVDYIHHTRNVLFPAFLVSALSGFAALTVEFSSSKKQSLRVHVVTPND